MHKVWTEAEKKFIVDNASILKDIEIATRLTQITGRNVSLQAVRKQRQLLGIVKQQGRGKCALKQQIQSPPQNIPTPGVQANPS